MPGTRTRALVHEHPLLVKDASVMRGACRHFCQSRVHFGDYAHDGAGGAMVASRRGIRDSSRAAAELSGPEARP